MADYIEFHARSAFSFLEGASLPEGLAEAAADCELPAIALLDRDVLSGAPRFHSAAKSAGIRAFIGAEVSEQNGTRLSLLARNRKGYKNICKLITRMKLRAPKGEGAVQWNELEECAEGIVCLTGADDGPLAAAIKLGEDAARGCLHHLNSIYGQGNVYAEVQRHHRRDEEARNQAVVYLARATGTPLLATNGVNHARAGERQLQDTLTCIRHLTTIHEAGKLLAQNAEHHLKTAKQMRALFADLPDAVNNTLALAERMEFTLANLGYEFPKYPTPPGEDMNSLLHKLAHQGARHRYRPYHERARRQIEKELSLIAKLELAGYFLIVWDIVQFCRREGILVQGRGSAANSAVCYSLGITAVDPVGMELLFERFLSEERGEWPDIDLDLPSGDQREKVIQHVYQRYGELGAAMTANVITYRERSAARDVGKAMGFDPDSLDRLSKFVRANAWNDPEDTSHQRFREAGFDPDDQRIAKYLELFTAAQDLPRHLGQHSGGMVICQGQLDAIVPLEPATMPNRVIVQWDKEDCADMGIIKVDLLGLGMMAVLEDSIEIIRDAYDEEVDLAHLPANDKKVYAALQRADTIGMFQVESRAQMSCLPRLKPKCFYDIVVEVAIIRPGPIVGKMVHPYLNRRQGREPVTYAHPALEPALKRTLGVPLFQEQLLRMAMEVAGFSGGEAEELRRAFGFKRSERKMEDIERKLRAGMNHKGITDEEVQSEIVRSITSFALYGFPESHAASFALISYASAYLKCHYLAAFTAALLNNQPMGFYSPSTLIKDAQRHGLHFNPVDVVHSDAISTVVHDRGELRVRMGLNYVKGLRRNMAARIVEERGRAPFDSIQDLKNRVPELRKNELSILAEAGALNSLQPRSKAHRRGALWDADLASRPAGPLFAREPPAEKTSPLRPMNRAQRLVADFQNTGLSIGPHPMRLYRERLERLNARTAAALHGLRNGLIVRVAGAVITRQRPGTAKGFLFISLEDETGVANIIVTPDMFARNRTVIVSEQFLLIDGVLQNQEGVIHVRAGRIRGLNTGLAAAESHDFH